MLEIQPQKQHHWRRYLAVFIIILLIVAGGYVTLVVFSPLFNQPFLTGKSQHAAEEELTKPPGDQDRLYIPKINVDIAIVAGSDSSALEKGAWHRKPENGDPVDGGNFVLSAHRFVMDYTPQGTVVKSPFYNIGQLEVGDRLYVDYKGKRYKYDISKKYTVTPNASEIEVRTIEPKLTLYSCTWQGSGDGRDVIEALPVVPKV